MNNFLQVAVGGAVGATARYGVTILAGRLTTLPLGTLAVNVTGCFAMGLLAAGLAFRGGQHLAPLLLTGVALAVVAALGVWLRRAESALVATALGVIAGGAVGNVIDRVRFGAVVDFLHAHAFGWSWYVFNVADAAIVCGVGALVLDGFLPRSRLPAQPVKQ